ncbi:hypothetical protein [Caballeronia insecticola]|nr:hypothetical protein [Caballeronia insecticola]
MGYLASWLKAAAIAVFQNRILHCPTAGAFFSKKMISTPNLKVVSEQVNTATPVSNWEPDTDYNTNDLVWWEDSTYGAMASHHSSSDFMADLSAGMWRIVGSDLAERLEDPEGSSLIGFVQSGAGAGSRTALDKMRECVTVDDYYRPDLGDVDHTQAFARAMSYLASRGGGIIRCPGNSYRATQIVLGRFILIEGMGAGATELIQSPGANRDFLVSENFAALTLSGLRVSQDSRVPSWFGIKDIRVNGNGAAQNSGRCIAWYGAAILMKGDVFVYAGHDDNIYTEYAISSGSGSWQQQEEGLIDNVTTMRSVTGVGWRNRGPHNTVIKSIISGYNATGGYIAETLPGKYDGNVTEISHLHTYANVNDVGALIGSITGIAHWIIDGDYGEISASTCQIGRVKIFNGGQTNDGLRVLGNDNNIGTVLGMMYQGTTGRSVVSIAGSGNNISIVKAYGQLGAHTGLKITGSGNTVDALYARECSIGLDVSGSLSRVGGKIILPYAAGFKYTIPTDLHRGKNRIDLEIYATQGVYVTGDRPVDQLDQVNIKGSGLGVSAGCRAEIQSDPFALDNTNTQVITVPHGLLYTPTRQAVSLTLLESSPADTSFVDVRFKVVSCDATYITVQVKVPTAAAAGTKARIGVRVTI